MPIFAKQKIGMKKYMNGVQTWGEAITMSLFRMWESFASFVPSFIGALVVFVAGWIVSMALGKIVEKIVKTIKIDNAFQNIGWGHWLDDMGISSDVAAFCGGITRWFLVLVFLMAATDILQLTQVTVFLNSILLYIPNVVVSVIILAIVFLVGNFVYSIVKGSTKAAGVMSATLLASISKWSIIIFGILAVLLQLGIAESLVNTIFIGVIAMLSLAGGLAFGLGGREEAAMVLRKLREEITERH
ncbi:MAG: TM helix repeat-containing protein [uncultured bacterium]|nr:MAG: TM helix repeat-containing protein [uncultured bacterium]